MENGNGIVFSGRSSAGRTTYFVDVRQAVNFRFYISVTESRRVSDSGFDQSRIFIFEENAADLRSVLEEAFAELTTSIENRGPLPDGQTSEKFQHSGKSWTEEDEELLRKEFEKNTERELIARKLKRSEYAVTLRLEKLGLIEKPASEPASAGTSG